MAPPASSYPRRGGRGPGGWVHHFRLRCGTRIRPKSRRGEDRTICRPRLDGCHLHGVLRHLAVPLHSQTTAMATCASLDRAPVVVVGGLSMRTDPALDQRFDTFAP